jgi:uncharacterized membrane protein
VCDSWLLVCMIIIILAGFLFFCIKFFQLSKRVENPERKYLRWISLGWLLITIGGVTGAAIEATSIELGIVVLIGKLIMTIGIIFNYIGFLPSSSQNKKMDQK